MGKIKTELITKYYVVSDDKHKIRCSVTHGKDFVVTGFNDKPFTFDRSSAETLHSIGHLIAHCATLKGK